MLSEDEDLAVLAKVVLCGDSAVGKTNLLMRYLLGTYQPETKATIGVDFFAKNVVIGEKNVKIQFFDTAGQEKYRSICSTYFKNVNGIILVYDITNRKSFESLEGWLDTIYRYSDPDIKIMLIGNKKDLEDIPEEYRNKLTFVPVRTIDDVLEVVLAGKLKVKGRSSSGGAKKKSGGKGARRGGRSAAAALSASGKKTA